MKSQNFKYYLDDYACVYAIDENNKYYFFNIKTGKLEELYHCVDLYWAGCTLESAKKRIK